MHAFVRYFIDGLSRMTEFANAGNLGEALHLMAERHLVEVEQRRFQGAQSRARKLMQRPRQFHPAATEPALSRHCRRGKIRVAGCLAPQSCSMEESW